jgi:hypothetical protein
MWRIFKTVLAAAILYLLLVVAGSAKTLFPVHTWVRDYLGDLTGTDPTVAWLMAGAVFALVCLVPWRLLLFAPVTLRSLAVRNPHGLSCRLPRRCCNVKGRERWTEIRSVGQSHTERYRNREWSGHR